MLIVNADDLGRCPVATDRILACYSRERISSASGMVFMEDSERAAQLARSSQLDVGLHVNFTESFTSRAVANEVRRSHERIRRFLRHHKYALLLYNPFLRRAFREVFHAQTIEFTRLYGHRPTRIDGHQHMHLCTNVLLDGILPYGTEVRRSFSFTAGEKNFFNRAYRAVVDYWLAKRHRLTDYFFALSQHLQPARLAKVVALANGSKVELMTHPEAEGEHDFLLSDAYAQAISPAELRSFSAT